MSLSLIMENLPHTVLFVIGLSKDAIPEVHVPDDPAASAEVSGPTRRSAQLNAEQIVQLIRTLPREESWQVKNIFKQVVDALHEEAKQASTAAIIQRETVDRAQDIVRVVETKP